MSASIEYLLNKASVEQITDHLRNCDADFVPALSTRVEIRDYARKIASKAMRFEAWSGGTLVGLVAAYLNDQEKRIAYITSVSMLKEWMGKGVAAGLMGQCLEHAKASNMRQMSLEVASDNTPAIALYVKHGFVPGKVDAPFVSMNLYLGGGDEHERQA